MFSAGDTLGYILRTIVLISKMPGDQDEGGVSNCFYTNYNKLRPRAIHVVNADATFESCSISKL